MPIPPEERPTAEQLKAQSLGVDPWACPHCGCRGPHKVVNTYDAGMQRRRRRICRNCKQGLVRTAEVPVPPGHHLEVVRDDEDEEKNCAA